MTQYQYNQLLTLSQYYPLLFMAISHHRTHKNSPITFDGYHYLKQLYCDDSDYIVVAKATQSGVSEWLSMNAIMKSRDGRGVFYVMPTDRLASRFVKNRIDRTIDFTQYYKSLVKKQMSRFAESTSLKHIGAGSIAFVGSNTPTVFTEYPADDLIIDELDQCNSDNIKMAIERLSASKDKRIIKVSNPTFEGFGIDVEYAESDQKKWFIKCSNCGKMISPDFFQHVVKDMGDNNYVILDDSWNRNMRRDVFAICHLCNKPYDRKAPGEWVKQNNSDISGYHISKMFSTNVTIKELLDRFEKGLINDKELERFYNGDIGVAFTSRGAKIDYKMLDDCIQDYTMPDHCSNPCVCGIDVGNKLHVRIDELLNEGKTRAVYINTVDEIDDLKDIFKRYNIKLGCIDAMPEKRLSKKVCALHRNFFMVYYSKTAKKDTIDIDKKIVTVDRTASLDAVKESIVTQSLILPKNARNIAPITSENVSEYYQNMTASTRVFDEEKQTYNWVEGSKPDHYFHAENYKSIAKKLLIAYKK